MMKNIIIVFLLLGNTLSAQKINFIEYNLENGMHVILHENKNVPVVTVGVMYHVGAKDEDINKTGMAHFFEHLLFEGSENIQRGDFFKIVSLRGGNNNANTTADRTYYYETLPSSEVELGLWLEAERLRQPVIDEVGVKTQNEVVKEEKRTRIDNVPYGKIYYGEINKYLFENHPYKNTVIGSMEDLDSQTLEDFLSFKKKWYNPANATLVVAGNIDVREVKKMIYKYFGTLPAAVKPGKKTYIEPELKSSKIDVYDNNIATPALVINYRYGNNKDSATYEIDFLDRILSGGETSRLYKRLVDEEKLAMEVFAYPQSMEDHGIYRIVAMPMENVSLDQLQKAIDEEIEKIQDTPIPGWEYNKVQNQIERQWVESRSGMQNIAHALADYSMLKGNTDLINQEISIYKSFTPEQIKTAAQKLLPQNKRVIIHYLPRKNI